MFLLFTGVHIQSAIWVLLDFVSLSFFHSFDKPILLFEILLKTERKIWSLDVFGLCSNSQFSVWGKSLGAVSLRDIFCNKIMARTLHWSEKHSAVSPSQTLSSCACYLIFCSCLFQCPAQKTDFSALKTLSCIFLLCFFHFHFILFTLIRCRNRNRLLWF